MTAQEEVELCAATAEAWPRGTPADLWYTNEADEFLDTMCSAVVLSCEQYGSPSLRLAAVRGLSSADSSLKALAESLNMNTGEYMTALRKDPKRVAQLIRKLDEIGPSR